MGIGIAQTRPGSAVRRDIIYGNQIGANATGVVSGSSRSMGVGRIVRIFAEQGKATTGLVFPATMTIQVRRLPGFVNDFGSPGSQAAVAAHSIPLLASEILLNSTHMPGNIVPGVLAPEVEGFGQFATATQNIPQSEVFVSGDDPALDGELVDCEIVVVDGRAKGKKFRGVKYTAFEGSLEVYPHVDYPAVQGPDDTSLYRYKTRKRIVGKDDAFLFYFTYIDAGGGPGANASCGVEIEYEDGADAVRL